MTLRKAYSILCNNPFPLPLITPTPNPKKNNRGNQHAKYNPKKNCQHDRPQHARIPSRRKRDKELPGKRKTYLVSSTKTELRKTWGKDWQKTRKIILHAKPIINQNPLNTDKRRMPNPAQTAQPAFST